MTRAGERTGLEIAVIGMAGRFPGASSIDQFWQNLCNGVESIVGLNDDDLRRQGVSESDLADPDYLKVGAPLQGHDEFDAAFFGFSPREAELLDPQHRLFLEVAWQAIETAGYDASRIDKPVGVYGGAGMNGYLLNLYGNAKTRSTANPYELYVGNDKDFLASRVSYKLDLRGPSLTIQTACSSSLAAVHVAVGGLLSGECDMALAGGVAITKQLGYRVQQGNIYSSDGHCRAFDADASGTVGGNGVGVVVLKRLSDAIEDGDSIDAIIRGSAMTNDGADKVSYTAPRVESQSAAIRNALVMAEVSADSISYVEAHGTGTKMGDPIELAALSQAFAPDTERQQYCAIGSVKTNIGHLDAAAGIAGLLKTVLSLKHQKIAASLHFKNANPEIDFAASPFYVNTESSSWCSRDESPRRAGVSSFGIGGTNVHLIVEEFLDDQSGNQSERSLKPLSVDIASSDVNSEPPQIALPISARTETALVSQVAQLVSYLGDHGHVPLADIAFTLQEGRREFEYRTCVVANSHAGAIERFENSNNQKTTDHPSIIYVLPDDGLDHIKFVQVFDGDPVFHAARQECEASIRRHRVDSTSFDDQKRLARFATQYALAAWFRSVGITPAAIIGTGLAELSAGCMAGIFSADDAVRLIL
ncbi:MAG: type I polyketide synthase, partial [Planctomycetota bacterium]